MISPASEVLTNNEISEVTLLRYFEDTSTINGHMYYIDGAYFHYRFEKENHFYRSFSGSGAPKVWYVTNGASLLSFQNIVATDVLMQEYLE